MPPLLSVEVRGGISALRERGKTATEISEILGVPISTVYYRLGKECGWKRTLSSSRPPRLADEHRALLRTLILNRPSSTSAELGAQLNHTFGETVCSLRTIRRTRKDLGFVGRKKKFKVCVLSSSHYSAAHSQ